MRKTGLVLFLTVLSVIAQSRADDQIRMEYDSRTQSRVPVPVQISKVIDATTLLSDKSDVYSLTGLDIPFDNQTPVLAQQRIAKLAEGQKCRLIQTRNEKIGRVNRMNQKLGHLICGKDDVWLQGALLSEGLARVRTTPENDENVFQMLTLEMKARLHKKGLWALPMNAPLTPETAAAHIDSFGIVEGHVYNVSPSRDMIYLNFSRDWKNDFTIGIPSKLKREFSKVNLDPLSFRGRAVRVRGWLRNYNGPFIELDHIAQLEFTSPKTIPLNPVFPPAERPDETPLAPQSAAPDTTQPVAPVLSGNKFMHTITSPIASPEVPQVPVPHIEKPAPLAPVSAEGDHGKAD